MLRGKMRKRANPVTANQRIEIRVTAEERARYQRAAGRRNLSAWLRRLADDASPTQTDYEAVQERLLRHLLRS